METENHVLWCSLGPNIAWQKDRFGNDSNLGLVSSCFHNVIMQLAVESFFVHANIRSTDFTIFRSRSYPGLTTAKRNPVSKNIIANYIILSPQNFHQLMERGFCHSKLINEINNTVVTQIKIRKIEDPAISIFCCSFSELFSRSSIF